MSDGLLNPLLSPENPTFGLCAVPQNAPSAAHQAQRTITPQPALSFAPPIDQTKPIGHGPSSGLALCIFSSPARLRSPLLAAYTWCRRAAKLKILCFMGRSFYWRVERGKRRAAEATRPFDSPLRLCFQQCDQLVRWSKRPLPQMGRNDGLNGLQFFSGISAGIDLSG